jgi:hypothetical protein
MSCRPPRVSEGTSKACLYNVIADRLDEARPDSGRISHVDGFDEWNLARSDTVGQLKAAPRKDLKLAGCVSGFSHIGAPGERRA